MTLWYYYSTLDNLFRSKGNKERKRSLISPSKVKNEKNRNENENPFIFDLVIGQEDSLLVIIDSDEDYP